jgi:hypothetical protein
MLASVATLADIPDGHKVLDVSGHDRIYLNGYVPRLMTSGQLVIRLPSQAPEHALQAMETHSPHTRD